jgi:hypothetical protein
MCKLPLGVSLFVCLFLFPSLASADSLATVGVNASFIASENFGSGPFAFLTGQFTLDEDTKVISSWSLTIMGPAGATYLLSPQNGGIATALCDFAGLPCPYPALVPFSTNPGWTFTFSNGSTVLSMDTLFNSALPFFPGESLQLCPLQNTFYPGNVDALSPACAFTSHATFNNQTGFMYELSDNSSSSGILTVTSVTSTPEPAESTLLLLGMAIIFGLRHFTKIPKRVSTSAA